MAETAEQLMIRMGFDATQVKLGLAKMQADNEAAAVRVTGIWKKAETDRRMMTVAEVEKTEAAVTVIEIEEATRRNRARYLLRQRGIRQEATLAAEQAAANVSMAAGSIPANMAGGAERKAASAAASGAEGAVAGIVGMGAIRGMIATVRGALVGSWNHMAMGIVHTLTRLGMTAATAVSSIPIIGTAVVAGIAMKHYANSMNEAGKVSDESNKAVGESRGIVAKRHAKWLAEKAKAEKKVQDEKDKLDVEHGKLVEKLNTVEVSGQWKLNSMLIQRHTLLNQMGFLEKDSVEYKKKQLEVDAANLEIQKQQKDVAREKSDIEKSIHEKKIEIAKITEEINKIGVSDAIPTLNDLAANGDGWITNQAKKHKANMMSGNSPFRGAARDAIWWKDAEEEDIRMGRAKWTEHRDKAGNLESTELTGGQAYTDLQNRLKAENKLSAAGLETPEMKQAAMQKGIDGINANIAELLAKAKTDGIKIADK